MLRALFVERYSHHKYYLGTVVVSFHTLDKPRLKMKKKRETKLWTNHVLRWTKKEKQNSGRPVLNRWVFKWNGLGMQFLNTILSFVLFLAIYRHNKNEAVDISWSLAVLSLVKVMISTVCWRRYGAIHKGYTEKEVGKLSSSHTDCPRKILNICWPQIINNRDLIA